jgi:hypothetical protein
MTRTFGTGPPLAKMANGSRKLTETSSAIVSRLSSQAPRGSTHDRESFNQLLQGLLGTTATQTAEGITIEDDVNVNHGLINVIVEAGLDTSNHDDPFVPADAIRRQILDSLAATDLVIRKTPNVLFHQHNVDSGADKDHDVLTFVWLVSKLLPLLGKYDDGDIEARVCNVLCSILNAQMKCSQSLHVCATASDYLQFCADGT